MKMLKSFRNPVVITGSILLACLASFLLWHSVTNAHIAARMDTVARELKGRPEFSHVYVLLGQKNSNPEVKGKVASEAEFASLTNLLSNFAPDVPVGIWMEWPINRDPNYEAGGMIGTTVGKRGIYDKIGQALSSVSFFSFAVFLFSLVSTGFWHLWANICVERKVSRDLFILILAPFLSLALTAAVWWNLPVKGSNGDPWLGFISFLTTTALFTYCLYSMLKGRYLLLSSLGIFVSGLVALLGCLMTAGTIVELFMKFFE